MSDVIGEVKLNVIEVEGKEYGAGACTVNIFGTDVDGIAVKAGDERHVTDKWTTAWGWLTSRGCPKDTAEELLEAARPWTKEQYKAARDALAIQEGACNGSGIAHSLVEAYKAWLHVAGTGAANTSAPVRLMLHQLAHIAGGHFEWGESTFNAYAEARDECQKIIKEYEEAKGG